MSTSTGNFSTFEYSSADPYADGAVIVKVLAPLGRALFASLFIFASLGHFSSESIAYAAAQGVPFANILVPLSGVMALVGGLSVLVGFKTRLGALLLLLFLVPVTLTMHNFWAVTEPAAAQIQQVMFMKNVALMGGALLLLCFGAGPVSVDARRGPHRLIVGG